MYTPTYVAISSGMMEGSGIAGIWEIKVGAILLEKLKDVQPVASSRVMYGATETLVQPEAVGLLHASPRLQQQSYNNHDLVIFSISL